MLGSESSVFNINKTLCPLRDFCFQINDLLKILRLTPEDSILYFIFTVTRQIFHKEVWLSYALLQRLNFFLAALPVICNNIRLMY